MSNELNLALRIKTDLEAGRKQVEGLSQAIDQSGESARRASSATTSLGQSAAQAMADLRGYEESMQAASLSAEEVAEQEERLDRLMSQSLISMDEYTKALERLDKQEAALAKQHSNQEKELNRVMRTADRTAVEMQKLDSAAEELERAWRDGRISVEQYNRAMANIQQRRVELQATSGTMGRLGLNTREARRQVVTLGRSLAHGNFASAGTDLLRLSQHADRTGRVFTRILLPLAAVAAATAAISAVSIVAWRDQRDLENALILSGNAAGITSASFDELSRSIERNTNATIGRSREITRELVATGRFSRQIIESFGEPIARLQEVSGETTETIVSDFARMEDGIARWVRERNRSMNFVTAAEIRSIQALEERGELEAAMIVAAEAMNKHLVENARQLGVVERSWQRVKNAISGAKQEMLDMGSGTLQRELTVLERELGRLRLGNAHMIMQPGQAAPSSDLRDAQIALLEARLQEVRDQIADEERQAQEAAAERGRENAAAAAQERITQATIRADAQRQMQAELDKLERDFAAATAVDIDDEDEFATDFSDENKQRLEAEIRKRYADNTSEQQTQTAENYVKGLERQANAAGKTADEIRRLTMEEQELGEEQRKRAEEALDRLSEQERQQQVMRDAQQLAGLEVQLLRAQGREAEAAALEMEQQYGELLERLESRSDDTGKELVENLINLGELSRQLSAAEQEIERTLSDLARREQSIDVQRQAGLISEYEARRQILELHRETARVLEQQRPLLEELAQQPGHVGESARAALQAMDAELQMLHSTVTLLEETLRGGLERGLATAIEGLAKGTMTLREAIHALATTVTDAVIQMAAQQLAQTITGSLFGGGNDGAELKEGAAAVTGSAAALATAGGTLVTGAAALEAAAASLMAANAGQSAASASGSGGDSDWSWVTTAISLFAADGGLVTGPGTGTSDEIPAMLSNREFVVRNASVEQPGAEDFLHDFNRRGMAALEDWAPVYHSTGGLAGEPAPAMPSVGAGTLSDPAADKPATAQNNSVRFINVVDPELLRDWQESAEGEQVFVNMLRKNSSMIKQFSGGG